MILLQCHW